MILPQLVTGSFTGNQRLNEIAKRSQGNLNLSIGDFRQAFIPLNKRGDIVEPFLHGREDVGHSQDLLETVNNGPATTPLSILGGLRFVLHLSSPRGIWVYSAMPIFFPYEIIILHNPETRCRSYNIRHQYFLIFLDIHDRCPNQDDDRNI